MRDLQEGGLVGCSGARESVKKTELSAGYQNICEYANHCPGSRNPDRFQEECIDGGKYCIMQLIHLEQEK